MVTWYKTDKDIMDLSQILEIFKHDLEPDMFAHPYEVRYFYRGIADSKVLKFRTKEERDKVFEQLYVLLNKRGRFNIMDNIREYFKKHQDTYLTLAIVILIDHFIFEGAFRDKIKDMIDKVITKSETKLLSEESK